MKTKAVEREKVGLMLAQGFTKKEVANELGKSIHTVNQQTRRLYEKTGSRNLADITRAMIDRYSGINTEDIIINAMHDITILAAVAFFAWVAIQPDVIDMVKTCITSLLK